MDAFQIVSELAALEGVSGSENSVAEKCVEILNSCGAFTVCKNSGCVIGYVGEKNENLPTLMLEAHIDEIGMIVTYITDEGFLKIASVGGIDRRVLAGQQVTVYGKEKIKGVVASIPPHIMKENSKVPKENEFFIDTGMSREQAEKKISLGDSVLVENETVKLLGDKITSKALDNRCGAAAVIMAADILSTKKTNCNIAVLLSPEEETGERGAKMGAYTVNPDMAVVVDVSFARTQGESDEDCGELEKGPMIGIAPSLCRNMSDKMIKTAKEKNIPYQLEIMWGNTGTDADVIGVSGGGCRTVTVSIPQKHMHTPVEIISLKDVENTAKLIAEFAESV